MAWRGERLPRLYAILDTEAVAARSGNLLVVAGALRRAGVQLLQYRDKVGAAGMVLGRARAIGEVFRGSGCRLILNDWVELVNDAGWDGVHLGQGDLDVTRARQLVGEERMIGLSTHTVAQALGADREGAVDYVAYGPVFSTASKRDAEDAVGLVGLASVRGAVGKPLVAIGGISRERITPVLDAGADAVVVLSALLERTDDVEGQTRALLAEAARWDGGR